MKEKDRKSKRIIIIALILAILSLLLGLWTFSKAREFKIKEEANVGPGSDDINVIFSPVSDIEEIEAEAIEMDKIVGVSNSGESVGDAQVVQTEEGTIANLKVKFTNPGQEIVYTFYSHNTGKYDAYLDTITYANVNNGNFFKRCGAVNSNTTNRYLVSSACEDIKMIVKAGENVVTDGSITGIKNHKLARGESEKVTVIISYDKNGTLVDGDFIVEFGSVTLSYLSEIEIDSK